MSTDTDPEELVGGDDDLDSDDGTGALSKDGAATPSREEMPGSDVQLDLDEVDWANVNDEVEAAMMESDDEDEDEDPETGSTRRMKSRASSVMSEDDGPSLDDESPSSR